MRKLAIAGLTLALPLIGIAGYGIGHENGKVTVGGDSIGGIVCQEDEVIGYVPVGETPYELGCVHFEMVDWEHQP